MSLEMFANAWTNSPYTGQSLVVHLGLADLANEYGRGYVEIHHLRHQAALSIELLDAILNTMELDKTLKIFERNAPSDDDRDHCWEGSISYGLRRPWEDPEEWEDDEYGKHFGYIYVIKSGEYYKIGRTKDLSKRLTQLAIQLPEKPEVIHTIKTSHTNIVEHWIHDVFQHKRLNGEWFRLNDNDLQVLRSVFYVGHTSNYLAVWSDQIRLVGVPTIER